jgi:hypothetical protein
MRHFSSSKQAAPHAEVWTCRVVCALRLYEPQLSQHTNWRPRVGYFPEGQGVHVPKLGTQVSFSLAYLSIER